MKLSALLISNFKGIGPEIKILIDNIVVLIGPNNSCKSTILDAYEKYASMGSPMSADFFHNRNENLPISITGIFTDVTAEDVETIGKEWLIEDDCDFRKCAKFKFVWNKPEEEGEKFSFSNVTNDWKKGGAGGFNSLLKSRIPTPIRVNPNDGYESLEKVVKDIVAKSAALKLKADKSKIKTIIAEIDKLAKEVEVEIAGGLLKINSRIQIEVQKLFPSISVGFETGVGKFKAEDAIKEGSRFILTSNGMSAPLEHQGTGTKRAFLWSALNALCNEGYLKKGTTKITIDEQKILLLDEPEINLHPSIIRAARKAIYALAEVAGWQVMCTTHSPIFIDLTQDHTTLIKLSSLANKIYYFQTDKASFSDVEKDQLKMLNKCCPTVNEFFFYEKSLLVEGDTEYLAYQFLISKAELDGTHCVINCRGKANIPTFIKIFNQFQAHAFAIHDLDGKFNVNGGANAMWGINHSIRNAADLTAGRVKTVVHKPDFEGYYLNESPSKDKPYNLFSHITADDFDTDVKYIKLRSSFSDMLSDTHPGIYKTGAEIEALA
ncbi:ATP-dependent endonuclease [Duganella sp. BJB475]|uniref:ATP-dependent nuclease n=1 Tax=Duganella sp. BJB475 TaxID=2233914 RepID=UPI000E34DA46|nr:AAA family ATPase [Duganella sp. BJB475]RFP12184.1 endonuclease [Duganella sp. BJB475]